MRDYLLNPDCALSIGPKKWRSEKRKSRVKCSKKFFGSKKRENFKCKDPLYCNPIKMPEKQSTRHQVLKSTWQTAQIWELGGL